MTIKTKTIEREIANISLRDRHLRHLGDSVCKKLQVTRSEEGVRRERPLLDPYWDEDTEVTNEREREIEQAYYWEVGVCGDCWNTFLALLDSNGQTFAEAHDFNPEALVCSVLTGGERCLECLIEELEKLLAKAKSQLATARSTQPAEVATAQTNAGS